jgi:hypothetical protein
VKKERNFLLEEKKKCEDEKKLKKKKGRGVLEHGSICSNPSYTHFEF